MDVVTREDRTAHWIKRNHQCRIPKRWVAFDTESRKQLNGKEEVQTWRLGAAFRWRTDLKTGDHVESETFLTPESFWEWVSDYCVKGARTVVWAHNMSHDVRISDAFRILPQFGFTLEWCNLDRNISAMTWRSDHGTLVVADLWTWLPVPLSNVAQAVGLSKFDMPQDWRCKEIWQRYCLRDAEIVYAAVSQLIQFVGAEQLGNWQPTGAGMSYATWRHKFMEHKVLVHDDVTALTAERKAMHTGRAEAWRHGLLTGDSWTEIDMNNAYARIAAECDLPCKLKGTTGPISRAQYNKLKSRYRVLARCRVVTDSECVPVHNGSRTVWPVGDFETTLWDPEIDLAMAEANEVRITQAWLYTRHPILKTWAEWILGVLRDREGGPQPVVKLWIKHSSRALIGRLSLRTSSWEQFGGNPEGVTGISHMVYPETGEVRRLLHSGDVTLAETARVEGRDSLPQITGYIMSECRRRLWEAMKVAGFGNVAHVDTDSLIVNRCGLASLRQTLVARQDGSWHVKGTWRTMNVWGPRNYRRGTERKVAGVPVKAVEQASGVFSGERWRGLSTDLEDGRSGAVTVVETTWTVARKDPRRVDAPGASGLTIPLCYRSNDTSADSPSPSTMVGA